MKKTRIALTAALVASGLVGLWIVGTDAWLWYAAPDHAYGLMAFIGFDALLGFALWKVARPAALAAGLFAGIQFAAMVGDIVFYRPIGVASEVWVGYLLGNAAFMGLLILQVAVIGLAVGMVGLSKRAQTKVEAQLA